MPRNSRHARVAEAADPVVEIAPSWATERDRLLVEALVRRAQHARRDPAAFFGFAMREEHTQAPIEVAPHQLVLFDFVMAHERSLVRMPVGSSKTYCMSALTMWLLGQDPTERGAVISSTQGQAAKVVALARDYIANKNNEHPELRLVFPRLRPSPHEDDPWTQTKLVVERPSGIRDPSLSAVGVGGALPGSRLSWILVDDILDEFNTLTPDARERTNRWFWSTVLNRRDVRGSRIVVTNTPWHPKDLTYALESAGWPTLTMDIEGGIQISNTDWDSDLIRPAHQTRGAFHRLTAHDSKTYEAPMTAVNDNGARVRVSPHVAHKPDTLAPFDIDETVPLWPERFSRSVITQLRADFAAVMHEFNRGYMMLCRDDSSSQVKLASVDQCKALARAAGYHTFASRYDGPNLTVTGVDLAIGVGRQNDSSSLFTFEVIPRIEIESRVYRNLRRVLDIEIRKIRGRALVDLVIEKVRRYKSRVRVETNAAQDFLRQWVLDVDISVPVRAHTTGANKHHRIHGVSGVFIEIENGAWLFPNDLLERCPEQLQTAIDACLYFNPNGHTPDVLIAWWLAREECRSILGDSADEGDGSPLGSSLLAR